MPEIAAQENRAQKEHLRRQRIGQLIEELASALPKHLVCTNSRQPDVLNAAIKYVRECEKSAQPTVESDKADENCTKYMSKIKTLESYITELESRCHRYARLLDINGICRTLRSEEKLTGNAKVVEEAVSASSESEISPIQGNAENCVTTTCIGAPIILVVQQRIGGGRRKRIQTQFPTAFKVPPLLPKPTQPTDTLINIIDTPLIELETSTSELIAQTSNSTIEQTTAIQSCVDDQFLDEQPVIVNIGDEDIDKRQLDSRSVEDVAVETEFFGVLTRENECQTDFAQSEESQQKYVERGVSPCVFENVQPPVFKLPVPPPKYSQRKKQKTDAISEIVNYIVEMPRNDVVPSRINKCVEQQTSSRADVVCTPSMLRVVDMLQPVATTSHSNGQLTTNASRSAQYANKRSTATKQTSKRTEIVEKQSFSTSSSSSTSSWREFLPNFSQVFPSYCPPPAPPKTYQETTVLYNNNKSNASHKSVGNVVDNSNNFTADFSIESLRNGLEPTKTSRSSSHNQKIAPNKLSHFPCASNNNATSSSASCGVPIPYSEMPVFLPCFPHPPPSTLHENNKNNKSKRSADVAPANNPLIPTDGSQEVNLSNSIFDTHGNTTVNCGSFVPTYHSTNQSVNLYNFSSNKQPSSNSNVTATDDRNNSDLHPVAWQWTDHGFGTQTYSHQTDGGIQTSGQKVKNFNMASMFPEVTTPLPNSASSHMSPSSSYRWNDPTSRLSNEHMTNSAVSSHQYGIHEPPAWAPLQLRTYNNSNQELSSNSFMPSFNFSQSNNHA